MLTKEEQEPAKEEPPRAKTWQNLLCLSLRRWKKKDHRAEGPVVLIIVLVLLAALGGGFYYCWMNYTDLFGIPMGASDKRLSIKGLQGTGDRDERR